MKSLIKITSLILISITVIFLLSAIGLTALKKYKQHANRILSTAGVEDSRYVNINGHENWMYIRGENKENPLILFLHGGPGSPETHMAVKKFQGELEEKFIVVHWEQRGSGKSYTPGPEAVPSSLNEFVDDTIVATEYLRREFKKEKIYLIGHSWGTFLAVHAISRRPELYHAYLGIGQFVNSIEAERLSRQYTMNYLLKAGDEEGYEAVKNLGEPPYQNILESISVERKYLWKTDGFLAKNYSPGNMLWDILTFPEYSFYDLYRYVKGSVTSLGLLNNGEIWDMKLDRQILRFEIPVYFVSGEKDFTTPAILVEGYYRKIAAPDKRFTKIAGCAHMPNFEDPGEFNRLAIEFFSGR